MNLIPAPFPEELETPRLILRKHSLDLAGKMFAHVDADRERLGRFLPWVAQTRTVADEEAYIRYTISQWKNLSLFDYGLYLREGLEYMGNIGVHQVSWRHSHCELGYWILGRFEGHGYMTEAVAYLEELILERGFHRIEIRCSDLNRRSAGIPERLGYVLEGTLRDNAFELNAFRTTRVYGRLASDPRPPLPE